MAPNIQKSLLNPPNMSLKKIAACVYIPGLCSGDAVLPEGKTGSINLLFLLAEVPDLPLLLEGGVGSRSERDCLPRSDPREETGLEPLVEWPDKLPTAQTTTAAREALDLTLTLSASAN